MKRNNVLSPLTTGQSVRPPNIQINNHFEYSFACFSFNLTIGHHCCKRRKRKKKRKKKPQPHKIAETSHFDSHLMPILVFHSPFLHRLWLLRINSVLRQ